MLYEPEHTNYDWRWKFFGVPVRVHPLFWIVSAIFGWDLIHAGLGFLILWMACVFVSILIHEMGHIGMGLLFGSRGYVVLYSFGGLAVGSNNLSNRWQRMAVSLAGPGAEFILFGLIWLLNLVVHFNESTRFARAFYDFMFWINLFWGFLNLLPIWPLDGGMVSRDLCRWLLPGGRGLRFSLGLSIAVAALLAVNALSVWRLERALPILDQVPYLNTLGDIYSVFFFGWLAVNSARALKVSGRAGKMTTNW